MNLRAAAPMVVAMLLWALSAPDGVAGPSGARHGGHRAGGHAQARYVAPHRARAIPRTAYWAAPMTYAPASYYGSTYAPSYAAPRAAPALYYVPPISPNAPMFSFDGSPAVEPDWGWQRVNLQQLAAEVRAKREAGAKP